jgi:fatty acid desaturase
MDRRKEQRTMTRAEHQAIRSQLSFQRHYVFTLIYLLVDAGLFALGLWLLASGDRFGYFVSQFLFAVIFFHNFAILHECGHGTASTSRWLNTLTGLYSSPLCFMPYFPWKYIHTEHHTFAGDVDHDPTLKAIRDYREDQRFKNGLIGLAWRSWVPLLAFIQQLVLWSYPLMLLKLGRLRGRRLACSIFSIALLPLSYGTAHYLWPQLFNLANFALSFVIYLVLLELINFPHHIGTEIHRSTDKGKKRVLWEQTRVTRSCYYPVVMSELLLLNFNFHIEHHLFPTLPWYQLRRARTLVRQALGNEYQECVGISWNLENRSKPAREVFFKHCTAANSSPADARP